MDIHQAIAHIVDGQDLDADQMTSVMRTIMTGGATDAQIAALLVALRMKGETTTEITAAATVMQELATAVDLSGLDHAIDIVGTGGDASGSFNISTTSMFVAAAAGCQVAKHGNRAVSSRSGSADVLEAAGIRLDLTPAQVYDCVRQCGVGFMFAPAHHQAMKHAITPRRDIKIRTLFNILGPLTNPARVKRQILGVFSPILLKPLAEVLQRLGVTRALVINARDGLDEISINSRTEIIECDHQKTHHYDIGPEDFGLQRASLDLIRVETAADSFAMMQSVLKNRPGPWRDIVQMNAGAAIYIAGRSKTLHEGIAVADQCIADGSAWQRFEKLRTITQTFASSSSNEEKH
jgi:anthranilate phosphoribosyltransferase